MADYNEQFLGDLSDNFQNPTAHEFFPGELVLFNGSNVVEGSTVGGGNPPGDRDFFTFEVAEGFKVSNIILKAYESDDNRDSYFALIKDSKFPTLTDDSDFLVSKGIDSAELNKDLLAPTVGNSTGAAGRKGGPGELGPGTYSVWYQETGSDTDYAFDVELEATSPASYGQIQFDPDSFSVNEGDGTFDITLRRTGGSDGGVSVVLRRTGGTATNLVDMNFRPATVIFKDGETVKTITRSLIDDTAIEPTETINLEITTPRGGVSLGTDRTATISIIDNDSPPEPGRLTFNSSDFSVNEDNGFLALRVRRVGGSDGTITADVNLVGGSATNGSDFNFSNFEAVFGDGQTSKSYLFALTDDVLGENNETAIFELRPPSSGGGGFAVPPESTTLTIVDNDAPTVQGSLATAYVNSLNQIIGKAFFSGDDYTGALFTNTDGTGNPNDVVLGTSDGDNIWAGTQGNDLIDAGAGSDLVGIGSGNVTVFTGEGNDFVYAIGGGAGNNSINLGNGTNSFYAQAGNNVVSAGSGDDVIGLGTGIDIVSAGNGNNIVYMIAPNSSSGLKSVTTGTGQDYIQTGSSDDLLNGGTGFNSLFGGGGQDIFVASANAYNFIGDFQFGSDRISLSDISFEDLSFFQGSTAAGNASTTYLFANNVSIGEVANSTVAALNNVSNFT